MAGGSTVTDAAHADRATSARPRLPFLDNLRATAIVLVVVLHASITYTAFAPECWYVLDRRRSLLTAVVLLLDVPRTPQRTGGGAPRGLLT